jgi:hypothetical protein
MFSAVKLERSRVKRHGPSFANAAVPLLAGCTFKNGIVGYAIGDDDGKAAFAAMCDGRFVGHILYPLERNLFAQPS